MKKRGGRGAPTRSRRAWPSCATSRPSSRRCARRTTRAGDELHAAQGSLAEAALEVSRLEERIRYVVEGRQRVEQRLAELKAQNAQWAQRREPARRPSSSSIAEQIAAADEQAEVLAAQAEEQAASCRRSKTRVRAAQARATSSAQRSPRCSSRSRCSPPRAATSTSRAAQLEARGASGWRPSARARRARRSSGWPSCRAQSSRRRRAQRAADARLHELSEQVPALDEQRARAAGRGQRARARKQADSERALEALRALQEKVQTEGKLKPWLAKHGLDGLQGLWTQVHIEPGWETALEAALRERLNALEVGRLETVRAFAADAPPAKLAFYTPAAGGDRQTRTRRCRA